MKRPIIRSHGTFLAIGMLPLMVTLIVLLFGCSKPKPETVEGKFLVRAFNGASGVRTWTTHQLEQRGEAWTFIDEENGRRVWVSGGTVIVEELK